MPFFLKKECTTKIRIEFLVTLLRYFPTESISNKAYFQYVWIEFESISFWSIYQKVDELIVGFCAS